MPPCCQLKEAFAIKLVIRGCSYSQKEDQEDGVMSVLGSRDFGRGRRATI